MAASGIRDIQKLLGHSTVTMTERYAHVTPSVLRRAVDLLVSPANSGQPMGIESPPVVTSMIEAHLENPLNGNEKRLPEGRGELVRRVGFEPSAASFAIREV